MAVITEIEDLRRQAKRRVAKAIVGYVGSGSYTEGTMRANRNDFDAVRLRQRVAVDVGQRDTGGVRSGQDVLNACAMGARGAMLGRSYVYGLGALGKPGVTMALEIIRKELDVSMALSGIRELRSANRSHIVLPKDW